MLHLPGVKYMPEFTPTGARQDKFAVVEPNSSDFTMPTLVRPYVKLHGSVNWVESSSDSACSLWVGRKR
ncbi:hypothetical protein SAMN05216330_11824 [Bradyrhizobium sp. Ghvi]|nr:hypothetical protein SAMN05216330_11824 [Bradyrhizobium sp. Ghvi]